MGPPGPMVRDFFVPEALALRAPCGVTLVLMVRLVPHYLRSTLTMYVTYSDHSSWWSLLASHADPPC